MNIAVESWIASDILGQLQRLNDRHHAAQPFVDDYQEVLRKSQIYEVDAGHLKKEVESLHQEVLEKDGQLHSVEGKAWKIAQAEKFESERNRVREENESLTAQMSEISSRMELMTSRMESMTSSMEAITSEKERAMLELASAYTTIQKLEASVEQLEKDLAEGYMKSREGPENEVLVLKSDVFKLTKERADVMEAFTSQKSEMQGRASRGKKQVEAREQRTIGLGKRLLQLPAIFSGKSQSLPTADASVAIPKPSASPKATHFDEDFVIVQENDCTVNSGEATLPCGDFKTSESHPD